MPLGSAAQVDRMGARTWTRSPQAEAEPGRGEPISTSGVESAVNEIIAKRMAKSQQMRWNRWTVQPFLAVRTAVLNDSLADSFRDWFPGFRPKVVELLAA